MPDHFSTFLHLRRYTLSDALIGLNYTTRQDPCQARLPDDGCTCISLPPLHPRLAPSGSPPSSTRLSTSMPIKEHHERDHTIPTCAKHAADRGKQHRPQDGTELAHDAKDAKDSAVLDLGVMAPCGDRSQDYGQDRQTRSSECRAQPPHPGPRFCWICDRPTAATPPEYMGRHCHSTGAILQRL
jgi:hypothetical protein